LLLLDYKLLVLLLVCCNLSVVFEDGPSFFGAVVVSTVDAFAVRVARDACLEALAVLFQALALFAVAALRVPRLVVVAVVFRDVVICEPVRPHVVLILSLKLIRVVHFHTAILKLASILPWRLLTFLP
jgi:hypothetical protein